MCSFVFPSLSKSVFCGVWQIKISPALLAGTYTQQRCISRMPTVPMDQPDVVQSPNQQLTVVHCMDALIVCIMGRAQLL